AAAAALRARAPPEPARPPHRRDAADRVADRPAEPAAVRAGAPPRPVAAALPRRAPAAGRARRRRRPAERALRPAGARCRRAPSRVVGGGPRPGRLRAALRRHLRRAAGERRPARPAPGRPAPGADRAALGAAAMTREHRPERFAQLTYTSSDGGDRPGGWGVQDVAGTLDAPERAALTRRIVPRFVPVPGLPAYPAPEQLAARPARVVHAPAGPGTAYWHTVACGTDAHGRPGNVFVHVLLDRGPPATEATGSPVRPADLAASGSWLRPFGHAEVATTALRTVPAPPWTAEPGRAAVLDFLFAEGGAGIATLCLLLDALDAALRGGRPVVLGPAAMDRAPLWIAAADHLMSLGAARRCGWSTYERVPHAGEWPADLHLVAVPAADLAAMSAGSAPSATVLDEDEEVPRADLGDAPRTTRHGEQVAVTPWSVMAFVVLAERAGAEALLSRMDAAGAAVPEATHPAWAMAMAIAQAPDLAPDAVPAACAVLSSTTPPSVAVRHPALYDDVLALVSR
ncbi:uncharacterized protein LOC110428922, partial [Herrania umbratica]|uniref:Uncharacterized protein LOC110428922 n=1 Tax=Herrania umbratica TaxID=108875 RepID=A0A6J1BQH4_9ROSI